MKFRLVLVFLLCCACSCAQIAPPDLKATPESTAELPFRLGPPCFSGLRSSYDDWSTSVVSQNVGADLATFRTRFPRVEFESYKRDLDCYFIVYPVGELNIRGIYARPKVAKDERLPVVIVNRGGNGPSGAWNLSRLFHTALPLASEGFVIIGSQYRGSRKGKRRHDDANDEFGGKDIEDVLALFGLIDNTPGVDPDRIGMSGWSRGGMMAFIAATKTDRLSAIAVGGTPTDIAAELLVRPEMERVFRARIPNYDDDKKSALEARSALMWADEIEAQLPVLILHGESDKRVSVDSALNMAEILRELDHPLKLVLYENGTHGLLEYNEEVRRELSTWFKTYLAVK